MVSDGGFRHSSLLAPSESADASPAAPAPTFLRVLFSRVDWWETAYRVIVSDEAQATLARAAKSAEKSGRAELVIGGLVGEVKATKRVGCYSVTNGEMAAMVTIGEASGWTFSIAWRSLTIARSGVRELIDRGRRLALSLGERDGTSPEWERMRRIDLAVDVEGWEIVPEDATAFVGRALRATGRGRVRRFSTVGEEHLVAERFEYDDEKSVAAQTWHSGDKVTTVAICYGAPLMNRTYDKLVELTLPGREAKREEEHARYRSVGWDGIKPIARNEQQWRGEALGEMRGPGGDGVEGHVSVDPATGRWHGCFCSECRARRKDPLLTARNPEVAARLLDELWRYGTTKWARMIVVDTATRRSRCKTDPRWELLQGRSFTHDAIAGVRVRHRVGPTVANCAGTVRAFVASRGLLPRIANHALSFSDSAEATEAAIQLMRATFALAFDEIATELRAACQKDRDAFTVLDDLVTRHNASVARYYVELRGPDGRIQPPPAPIVPSWLLERYESADERAAIREAS